jgi:hypothetical protein
MSALPSLPPAISAAIERIVPVVDALAVLAGVAGSLL